MLMKKRSLLYYLSLMIFCTSFKTTISPNELCSNPILLMYLRQPTLFLLALEQNPCIYSVFEGPSKNTLSKNFTILFLFGESPLSQNHDSKVSWTLWNLSLLASCFFAGYWVCESAHLEELLSILSFPNTISFWHTDHNPLELEGRYLPSHSPWQTILSQKYPWVCSCWLIALVSSKVQGL